MILARFAASGIGTYYALYYCAYVAALAATSLAVFLARKRLAHGVQATVSGIVVVLLVRLLLFDNPVVLRFYQRHLTPSAVGVRQWGVLDLEIDKYHRMWRQPKLANMAVGSSQVGAIFSGWPGDGPEPLRVFSLAGMKTLDYVLYEERIADYNPERVILYLSAFDLTASPELYSLPLAPYRPAALVSIPLRLRSSGVSLNENAAVIHSFIASQLLPEYRLSFIYRGLLKRLLSKASDAPAASAPVRRAPELSAFSAAALYRPRPPLPLRAARVLLTSQPTPADTSPAVRPEVVSQFVSYYYPEWLDYNYEFLVEFVAFCQTRGIQVVIAEGQINPVVNDAKVNALNQQVKSRFVQLEARFPNVTFLPAAAVYVFTQSEYADLTHVEPLAAMAYRRRLSSYLAERRR